MVGVCSEVVTLLFCFARCCSSRFALASSADPGVVGGGQREARESMEQEDAGEREAGAPLDLKMPLENGRAKGE